jgi:hypothetical protein
MKILLFLFGFLVGQGTDKSFDGTNLIVNQIFKGVYDEKRVETVAYSQEKYPKNKLD